MARSDSFLYPHADFCRHPVCSVIHALGTRGAEILKNPAPVFATTGTWPTSTSVTGYLGTNYQHHFANVEPPSAIVSDNASGSATGTWPTSTSVGGYYGANYQTHAAGTGANAFTWTLSVASAGTYEVYARWTSHPNRATNACTSWWNCK